MSDVFYDNTMLSAYQECQRKFALRHILDLVPNRKSMPLYFGEAMHNSLSKWYETGDVKEALAEWEGYVDNQWDDKRTKARGIDIAMKYFQTYPTEPFNVIANELPFQVELASGMYLTGKIDLLVEWHGGQIYVLDHKTTSRLGSTYFYQFKPSRQMYGYCVGASKILNTPVRSAVINALAVYKSNYGFERQIIPYRDSLLTEYERFIPTLMSEMRRKTNFLAEEVAEGVDDWTAINNYFLPNYDSCSNWSGCPYKDICVSQGAKSVIDTGYRYEHWDPREESDNEKTDSSN